MTAPDGRPGEPTPPVQLVTTAPEPAELDQHVRIRRYLIMMAIRTLSFVLAALTHGWPRWTFVALAVFLPYIAVVLVNAVRPRVPGSAMYMPEQDTRRLGR